MKKSVFIVGNGPSVLQKQLGALIDKSDIVVRINDFQIKGYEQHTGTRTTHLFACRLNEHLQTLDNFKEIIVCLLMNPFNGVTISDEVLTGDNFSDQITWDHVNRLIPSLKLQHGCYPSTGFLCIIYFIKKYGHVNIVGFDGFKHGNQHYYELDNKLIPIRHDGLKEREWIDFFETVGFVTDHSRNPEQGFKYYKYDGEAPYFPIDHL